MDKVLLVANATAREVSARTKDAIAKDLGEHFKLEVVDTERRNHASELARDAVDDGFSAVLAYGGDGTINEVAQGLVGTEVALGMIAGGSTNVMPRLVDVPIEPTEAGAFLASCLKSGRRRRINVGELDGRYFLFSAGMGLDGEVVKRVEANPAEKRKHKDWVFVKYALKLGLTQYRTTNPALTVHIDGHEPFRIVCAICCNACPMTYLKGLPVAGCPEARLDEGLDIFGLSKLRAVTVPRVLWSVMVNRSHIRWRTSFYHHDTNGARLVADHPMAVQVDGDYIGDLEKADIRLVRDALSVLA